MTVFEPTDFAIYSMRSTICVVNLYMKESLKLLQELEFSKKAITLNDINKMILLLVLNDTYLSSS